MSSQSVDPATGEYRERVSASPWLAVVLYASVAVTLVGIYVVINDDQATTGGRVIGLGILIGTGALLLAVARWFLTLEVSVSPPGAASESEGATEPVVACRYGPFGKRFKGSEVAAVEVESYDWWTYAGWGIRFAPGGRRAYSVPFLRTGVAIVTHDGNRTHLSSRAPEDLAAAIAQVTRQHGGH